MIDVQISQHSILDVRVNNISVALKNRKKDSLHLFGFAHILFRDVDDQIGTKSLLSLGVHIWALYLLTFTQNKTSKLDGKKIKMIFQTGFAQKNNCTY